MRYYEVTEMYALIDISNGACEQPFTVDGRARGWQAQPRAASTHDAHHLPRRAAAMAGREDFYPRPHIDQLADDDAVQTFVCFLVANAPATSSPASCPASRHGAVASRQTR
jgi:hypothetical protein